MRRSMTRRADRARRVGRWTCAGSASTRYGLEPTAGSTSPRRGCGSRGCARGSPVDQRSRRGVHLRQRRQPARRHALWCTAAAAKVRMASLDLIWFPPALPRRPMVARPVPVAQGARGARLRAGLRRGRHAGRHRRPGGPDRPRGDDYTGPGQAWSDRGLRRSGRELTALAAQPCPCPGWGTVSRATCPARPGRTGNAQPGPRGRRRGTWEPTAGPRSAQGGAAGIVSTRDREARPPTAPMPPARWRGSGAR